MPIKTGSIKKCQKTPYKPQSITGCFRIKRDYEIITLFAIMYAQIMHVLKTCGISPSQ